MKKHIFILALMTLTAGATVAQNWKTVYKSYRTGERFSLAEGPSGEVYLGFRDFQVGKTNVQVLKNGSWQYVGDSSFSHSWIGDMRLAVDADSLPVVAFQDINKNYNITVMKYKGGKWDTLGRRGFNNMGYGDFGFAAGGGNLFVSTQLYNTLKIWYYDRNTNTWLNLGNNIAAFPTGAEMKVIGNNLYVAYRENSGTVQVKFTDATNPSTTPTWVGLGAGFASGVGISGPSITLGDFLGNVCMSSTKSDGTFYGFYRYFGSWQTSGGLSHKVGAVHLTNGGSDTFPFIAVRDASNYGRIYKATSTFTWDTFGTSSLFYPSAISSNASPRVLYTKNRDLLVAFQESGTSKIMIRQYCAPTAGSINTNGGTNFCAADGKQISVKAPGARVQWYKDDQAISGASESSYKVMAAGNYKAVIKNACGDSTITAAVTMTSIPSPAPTITQNGQTLETQTFNAYQWYYNGTTINDGGYGRTYTPSLGGLYRVQVANAMMCLGTSPEFTWWPLGVSRTDADQPVIYPNPASQIISIRTSAATDLTVANAAGAIIWKGHSDGFISIPVHHWPAGIYTIRDSEGGAARIIRQ